MTSESVTKQLIASVARGPFGLRRYVGLDIVYAMTDQTGQCAWRSLPAGRYRVYLPGGAVSFPAELEGRETIPGRFGRSPSGRLVVRSGNARPEGLSPPFEIKLREETVITARVAKETVLTARVAKGRNEIAVITLFELVRYGEEPHQVARRVIERRRLNGEESAVVFSGLSPGATVEVQASIVEETANERRCRIVGVQHRMEAGLNQLGELPQIVGPVSAEIKFVGAPDVVVTVELYDAIATADLRMMAACRVRSDKPLRFVFLPERTRVHLSDFVAPGGKLPIVSPDEATIDATNPVVEVLVEHRARVHWTVQPGNLPDDWSSLTVFVVGPLNTGFRKYAESSDNGGRVPRFDVDTIVGRHDLIASLTAPSGNRFGRLVCSPSEGDNIEVDLKSTVRASVILSREDGSPYRGTFEAKPTGWRGTKSWEWVFRGRTASDGRAFLQVPPSAEIEIRGFGRFRAGTVHDQEFFLRSSLK